MIHVIGFDAFMHNYYCCDYNVRMGQVRSGLGSFVSVEGEQRHPDVKSLPILFLHLEGAPEKVG